MLNTNLRGRINSVDILTDFDEVMIREQSIYMQLHSYFSFLPLKEKWGFSKNLIEAYKNYKRTEDVSLVYSLFAGCFVEVIDEIVPSLKQNLKWSDLINKLNVKKVGIISRNSTRIISKYLDFAKEFFVDMDVRIIAANELEIENGIYTGRAKLLVNNDNLKDFVYDKGYICGKDEKRILESQGFSQPFSENDLFIFGNV
jgi:hypothetical protein